MSLHEVAMLPRSKQLPDGSYMIPCPVPGHGKGNGDKNPSCHVWHDAEKDRMAATCFSGCDPEHVREALEHLGAWDKKVKPLPGEDRQEWTIYTPDGHEIVKHIRFRQKDGAKTFRWSSKGVKPAGMLYRVEQLRKNPEAAVVICEGEKAADAVQKATEKGIALGTVTGASGCPTEDILKHLEGRHVVLWPDNDDIGRQHMTRLAKRLQNVAAVLRVVAYPEGTPEKADAADMDVEQRRELLNAAKPYSPAAEVERPSIISVFADVEREVFRTLDEYASGTRSDVVSTGLRCLDGPLIGGWQRGAMSLVAAPSGAGKTTLCIHFAAAVLPAPVLMVAPEMTVASLARREILRRAGASMHDYRKQPKAQERTIAAAMELSQLPLYFVDKLEPSMEEIRAAAEWVKEKHGDLPLVLLDYAQFLVPMEEQKRYLALAMYAQFSIELAQTLKTAVVLTSQVNVNKDTKEYTLRESAMLNHKAHLELHFYANRDKRNPDADIVDCHFWLEKQRDGPSKIKIEGIRWEPARYTVTELGLTVQREIGSV